MPKPKNEGYLGNAQVKRAGITEEWDDEKVQEYLKCTRDPAYFIAKYIKIISLDEGLVNFNLYEYQKNLIDQFINNRFNIVLACRQSGKSITVCAYLLWYILFHPEQTVAILANKGATAREMLSRITTMLENVPFFLQPGTKSLNKGSIDFENNSRIIASATTTSSIRGLSVNLLYLDEFAFVENAEPFYTGTYPVITSGKNSKVIITSTANGVGNMFHRIWEASVTGSNEFANYQVNWYDVPGRDEKWKETTISNTSEIQFEQEFGNSFLGTGRTLIPSNIILGLVSENPMELYGSTRIYKKPKPHHEYIMTVDTAEGKGMDYSTFTIFDIHDGNMFEQVATFRDNMISPMLLPDICAKYGKLYNDALIIVENNNQGTMVCRELYYELEYENMFLTSAIKADGVGVRMTQKVKAQGCAALKEIMEEKKLYIRDTDTIQEFATFVSKGQSWQADGGCHDDMVMNCVLFAWFVATPLFKDMSNADLKSMLYAEKQKEIENDIVPIGIMDGNTYTRQETFTEGGDTWTVQEKEDTDYGTF